jgi:hypothetical protein
MKYEVMIWLAGSEHDTKAVTVNAEPPLTPNNVKDFACTTGLFSWKDYQRIRFRRVKK